MLSNNKLFGSLIRAMQDPVLWRTALHIFVTIQRTEEEVSTITYIALISAMNNAMVINNWDVTFEIFNSMKKIGLNRNKRSYNILLVSLCKGKQWKKAFKIFRRMRHEKIQIYNLTYNILI